MKRSVKKLFRKLCATVYAREGRQNNEKDKERVKSMYFSLAHPSQPKVNSQQSTATRLNLTQRLRQVFLQVFEVLDADRQTHQRVADA